MYACIGDRAPLIFAMKRIESDTSRREGAYSEGVYGFLMRARPGALAFVCKVRVGFSEAAVPRLRLGGTDGRYAYIKRAQRIYHS